MKTVEKLLQIAAGEIGYREKETNSQLDSKTGNAGNENYTKYARDLHAAGYYQASKQGYDWCDQFVDWCFLQLCGNRKEAEAMICQTGLYGAGCKWSAKYYKQQGRFYTSDPQPGDQIFFNNFSHTGIVEKVENGVITTIEGNTSNRVKRCTYSVGSGKIDGYGRPKYVVETTVETVERKVCNVDLPVLKKGAKGASVKAMQTLLIFNGCSCGSKGADGSFGADTDKALRKYQSNFNLAVDGSCGRKTWSKLLGIE